jgi:hypothetical protein
MEEELYCIVKKGGKETPSNKLLVPGNVHLWDSNDADGYTIEEAKEALRNIAAYDNTYYDDDDFRTIVKACAEEEEITIEGAKKSATWYQGAGYYDNECNLVYREGETSYSEDGVTYSIEDYLIGLKRWVAGGCGFDTRKGFVIAAFGGVATTNGDPFCIEGEAYEWFKQELVRAVSIEKWTPEDGCDEYEWGAATRKLDFENPADVAAIYIVQGYDPSDKMLVALIRDYRN